MKRPLIFALTLFLTFTAMAQNVRRVAILETVDKEGNVNYGIKLQLRSALTYVISHMPGYEAYDRVDVSSVMDEHKFQRSGLVSEADIKKLGMMTGASYVLVAEVAVYDADNIVVTAKIIDVETGQINLSSRPEILHPDASSLQEACSRVAQALL